jgi:hypothetical protein
VPKVPENGAAAAAPPPHVLPPRQALAGAPALLALMRDAPGALTLDASRVEVVTTPALQVMLAGGDAIRAAGGCFAITNASPAARRCLEELGVTLARLNDGPGEAA